MKNASKKWPIFVNIFFHKMTYNIFTGYLSIGKWYSIDAELSESSISVFKVKICLEFGEILRPKDHRFVMPRALGFSKVSTRPTLDNHISKTTQMKNFRFFELLVLKI